MMLLEEEEQHVTSQLMKIKYIHHILVLFFTSGVGFSPPKSKQTEDKLRQRLTFCDSLVNLVDSYVRL